MPVLLAEVARVWEAATAMEAARVTVVLATETSALEAAVVWDSITLHVEDVKDQTTLAEREAWERVSRVEAENDAVLASAREDAKGLVRKISLLKGELVEERRA
jgi:hypothetical protein